MCCLRSVPDADARPAAPDPGPTSPPCASSRRCSRWSRPGLLLLAALAACRWCWRFRQRSAWRAVSGLTGPFRPCRPFPSTAESPMLRRNAAKDTRMARTHRLRQSDAPRDARADPDRADAMWPRMACPARIISSSPSTPRTPTSRSPTGCARAIPAEMTVVIQHWFENLIVTDEGFSHHAELRQPARTAGHPLRCRAHLRRPFGRIRPALRNPCTTTRTRTTTKTATMIGDDAPPSRTTPKSSAWTSSASRPRPANAAGMRRYAN